MDWDGHRGRREATASFDLGPSHANVTTGTEATNLHNNVMPVLCAGTPTRLSSRSAIHHLPTDAENSIYYINHHNGKTSLSVIAKEY